jgi:negative modulator of initiation of replication
MISIEIDNQVFAELERRASGFNATPNDVLRCVLGLQPKSAPGLSVVEPHCSTSDTSTVSQFISGERFQRYQQAVDRYLVILAWLHSIQPKQFADAVLGFHRGNRVYFAKSEKEVLESGEGITARQIPQSPFWALTTLDNKSKRLALEDILRTLGYARSDINLVLAELPDSGIRRNHGISRLIADL